MTSLSRAPRPLLAVLPLVALLALAGCGGTTPSAAPAKASTTAAPSSPPSPTTPASPSSPADTTTTAAPTPSNPQAQVISIDKFGISYELPKSWITLNAKNVLKDGARNPFLKQLADRLGASPDQLVRAFSTAVQSMSVSDSGLA